MDRTAKLSEGLAARFDSVLMGTNELTADRTNYGSICLRSYLNGPLLFSHRLNLALGAG